jgi:hypothetical protein
MNSPQLVSFSGLFWRSDLTPCDRMIGRQRKNLFLTPRDSREAYARPGQSAQATPARLQIARFLSQASEGGQDHRLFAGTERSANVFSNIFAIMVRVTEAGTSASRIRLVRPGMIRERLSRKALRPSDTHCSTFIGFMGMISGVRPSFASTGVSVGATGRTDTCTPSGVSSTWSDSGKVNVFEILDRHFSLSCLPGFLIKPFRLRRQPPSEGSLLG